MFIFPVGNIICSSIEVPKPIRYHPFRGKKYAPLYAQHTLQIEDGEQE